MHKVEFDIEGDIHERLERAILRRMWADSAKREAEIAKSGLMPPVPYMVQRVTGLKIQIWADEHPPPHFHVSYQGEDASFSILDCRRLPKTRGLEKWERTIRDWWEENRGLLISTWNATRPSDCPVGPIPLGTPN